MVVSGIVDALTSSSAATAAAAASSSLIVGWMAGVIARERELFAGCKRERQLEERVRGGVEVGARIPTSLQRKKGCCSKAASK